MWQPALSGLAPDNAGVGRNAHRLGWQQRGHGRVDAVLLLVRGRRDDPRRVPRAVRSVQRDGERCNATASVARNAGNDGTGQYDNAGNYTFGGFGAGSWSKEACCTDPRNDCESTVGLRCTT